MNFADNQEERKRFFILKRNSFVDFIKKIIDKQSSSGSTLLGWCRQREKIDWQEVSKFDCRLVQTIFIFCCPSSIFTSRWRVARKSNFDSWLDLFPLSWHHPSTLPLLEEWANKTYPELQAKASKLHVIMMMGMEDQLVCDTLVKYGLSKDKILPEEKKKLGCYLKLFAEC